tara:strand:- start:440 stop:859 length:420 start_codon:yes stop_codon:yes gene_type:complete
MTQKKCADLVQQNYQARLKDIKQAYQKNDNEKNIEQGDYNNFDLIEWLSEYGLSWGYVLPNTFDNQSEGYYRWQLSWGGPSDEFRIFTDNNKNIQSVEYWYLDWFDGASIEIDDYQVIEMIKWQLELDKFPYEYEDEVA